MSLTASGFVLLPLCLVFFFRPDRLLQFAFIASAFGAAAPVIINFGGAAFGLQSGFLPGLLFLCLIGVDYLSRIPKEGEWATLREVMPMLAFAACAVAGSFILPRLFAGQFEVWPQRVEFGVAEPLAPNAGNTTQSLYIIVNVAIMLFTALYLSRPGTRHMVFVNAYLVAGYLVAALSFWQFANKQTGVYFPEDFLYSNPRWALATQQAFGDVNRINGPFTEPAALSTYMSGMVFACLWMVLRGHASVWVRLLLLLSLLCVWLSTSTTGLVVLGVFLPLTLVSLLRSAGKRELRALLVGTSGLLGIALTIYVISAIAFPSFAERIEAAVDTVVFETLNKSESSSYADRTTKDTDALAILAPSLGLGAGWGSLRSSSLLPGILGNTGVPGLVLLGWFAASAIALVTRARRLAPAGEARIAMDAMWGSIIGSLCAAVLSAPTIDSVDFFLRLAVMISCATRICLDARASARPSAVPSGPFPPPAAAGAPRPAR